MNSSEFHSRNSSYDACKNNFDKLISELQNILITTEEDTRFQVIDRLLIEILGWSRDEIQMEKNTEGGYADYLLQIGGRNKIILEAKRGSKTLIDSNKDSMSNYKLSGPVLKSAADGIKQAQNYCSSTGVQYAVLTNGQQWIFFRAIRSDGIEPHNGKAIVFPSLISIQKEFAIFYDMLSKEAIADSRHFIQLDKAENSNYVISESLYIPIDENRLTLIPPSILARDLRPIFSSFFGLMSGDQDREMLAECFVESKESKDADISLKKIAQNLESNIVSLTNRNADELKQELLNAIKSHSGEFILIIGQKGAGKTTFIDRFFSIILDTPVRKNCLLIKIDVNKYNTDQNTLNEKLLRDAIKLVEKELFQDSSPTFSQLRDIFNFEYAKRKKGALQPLYKKDLTEFELNFGQYIDNLIANNPDEYLIKLLHNSVRSRKLMPCIIFDNTDQFPQEFQEAVFQFAQSIFSRIDYAFVICPITDRSIWQLSKSGPFQSYHTKQFFLPVPKTGEILQKRVDFLKRKILENKKNPTSYFMAKGMQLKIENLENFAAYIEDIFVNEEFVTGKIGRLANFEIRRMLNLAEKVITSPSLSSDDLFKAYLLGNKHKIRSDKIDKALILESHNYYHQHNNDYIFNIFQINKQHIHSPLLFLRILLLLEGIDNKAKGDVAASHHSLYQIQNFFELMSVDANTITTYINHLYFHRLIESFDVSRDYIYEIDRVRITPAGKVHIDLALRNKMYLSNMAIRTEVRNYNIANELRILESLKTRESYSQIISKFIDYCLTEDKTFIHVPQEQSYFHQQILSEDLKKAWHVKVELEASNVDNP